MSALTSTITGAAEACARCASPIEYVHGLWKVDTGTVRATPEQVATGLGRREWFHVGAGQRCEGVAGFSQAGPLSKCPDCQARGTLTTRQEAWYDVTTCSADGCVYRSAFAVGD